METPKMKRYNGKAVERGKTQKRGNAKTGRKSTK
jgi:hypothetical protein